jgi:hypothetical protein
MSFESLEDNFMKKVNEPVKTDVQKNVDIQKKLSEPTDDKETYEDSLTKKQVLGGLAALFQEKIKEASGTETESDDTVFISTENLKYGDKFVDPTNYVSEKDIQKFMPGDVYNDSIKEPDLDEGSVEFDQRHSSLNRYDDNLTFEPSIASENDISPASSISKSVGSESPYSDKEIDDRLASHNEQKKKKQFSENTWSANKAYTVGPQIPEHQTKQDSDSTYVETEISKEEHEKESNYPQDSSTES